MPLQKTYREETLLLSRDCDLGGLWRPSAILTAMQETAGAHSHALGCGRQTLVKNGIVWVLTRCEVRMDREAHIGERLSIETFPMPLRRWFFPRYFVFRDAAGEQLGAAGTLWVLFDLEKRCMVAPGEVAKAIPDNSDLIPPLGVPGPVPRLTGAETESMRMPVYSELDVNGHVNNARYADWLCDALGMEAMRDYRVKTMRLSYAAEIRPGQEMRLRFTRDGLAYHLTGTHEGKVHFEIGGELEQREQIYAQGC